MNAIKLNSRYINTDAIDQMVFNDSSKIITIINNGALIKLPFDTIAEYNAIKNKLTSLITVKLDLGNLNTGDSMNSRLIGV